MATIAAAKSEYPVPAISCPQFPEIESQIEAETEPQMEYVTFSRAANALVHTIIKPLLKMGRLAGNAHARTEKTCPEGLVRWQYRLPRPHPPPDPALPL